MSAVHDVCLNITTAINENRKGVCTFDQKISTWVLSDDTQLRSLNSLTFPQSLKFELIKDIEWFTNSYVWYQEKQIPYRRGYLLEGPHGTGKTSLIKALAKELGRKLYILELGSITSDNLLRAALAIIEKHAIVVIEDVDAIISKSHITIDRKFQENTSKEMVSSGITLSGLLNALDGVGTSESNIVIMTTNYPERIDPALLRPGRIDRRFKLDLFAADMQVEMASKYYKNDDFVPLDFKLSPADLQAAFMQYPEDPHGARQLLLETHTKENSKNNAEI